eukprot:1260045-Karenia_brevis.AAC.1
MGACCIAGGVLCGPAKCPGRVGPCCYSLYYLLFANLALLAREVFFNVTLSFFGPNMEMQLLAHPLNERKQTTVFEDYVKSVLAV